MPGLHLNILEAEKMLQFWDKKFSTWDVERNQIKLSFHRKDYETSNSVQMNYHFMRLVYFRFRLSKTQKDMCSVRSVASFRRWNVSGKQGHIRCVYLYEATWSRNLIAGLACFAWCPWLVCAWKPGPRSRGEEGRS